MRKFSILFILAAVLLAGCSLLGGGITTITGTINGSTVNVVVAVFSEDYWFLDSIMGDEDEVASEFSGGTSFTPIVTATISGTSYSIELPEDPAVVGDFIAWVDSDNDGVFDLGDGEAGYFPMKTIDGTAYVVSFGYILNDYTYGYFANSQAYNVSISSDSDAAGFNFTVD